jgi:hypothetical protein
VTLWRYETAPDAPPRVVYRVWDGTMRQSYEGPTLEIAMELAIGCDADLASVERTLEGLAS